MTLSAVIALATIPHPEGTANAKAALALLRGLRAHGVVARAVAPRLPGDELVPPNDVDVDVVAVPEQTGWSGRIGELTQPRGHLASHEWGARVRALAREADVVYCDEVDAARGAAGVSNPTFCHVYYLVERDRDRPSIRSHAGREWLAFWRAERWASRNIDHLVFSSPIVAANWPRSRHGRSLTVRMPIDQADYPVASLAEPVGGVLGTASWVPTAAAIDRLAGDLWPRIRAAVPGARLRIAGRGTDRIEGIAAPGVEVLGAVESASAFLGQLGVLLYPVPRGSGVKTKVLESLACGVPVVTTPDGAEGCEPNDGLLVAGDDDSFVRMAVELLTDAEARRQRGIAARAAVVRAHAPEGAVAPLVAAFEAAAS